MSWLLEGVRFFIAAFAILSLITLVYWVTSVAYDLFWDWWDHHRGS